MFQYQRVRRFRSSSERTCSESGPTGASRHDAGGSIRKGGRGIQQAVYTAAQLLASSGATAWEKERGGFELAISLTSFADVAKTLGIEGYTPERAIGRRVKAGVSQKSTDWDPVRLKEALSHISADNQPEWFKVGAALHNASDGSHEGFDLWDEWSRTTTRGNYDAKQQSYIWDRYFGQSGRAITVRSIYKMRKESAFRP
ncbi:hypothetical protein FJW04_09570 [Mesorhizobium sp. B2-7-3]|nr:hypothetical protein FJW04_09570 [Mesorhizobium sp. B2-7-3]